jgi:predicted GIY-YIG superfamily endonuclease
MAYVYILRSEEHPERHYVGVTSDLRGRLKKHNAGEVARHDRPAHQYTTR